MIQVNVCKIPELGLVPPFVNKIYDGKQREEDVSIYKVTCVEWTESRPTLDEGKKDVGAKAKVRVPRIPEGLEWQLLNTAVLALPRGPEADMDVRDGGPDQERTDPGEVDDVSVCLASTCA